MSRKLIFVLGFTIVLCLALVVLDIPALAATSGQEENPVDRLRPDQYSYHGMEELPYLPSADSGEVNMGSLMGPVDQWSKMVFESYLANEDKWEIYLASGGFTNLTRLTNNSKIDIFPRLNRGSTRIAFVSDRDNYYYEIYTMKIDGTDIKRLTSNGSDDVKPAWSPDGTHIAFQTYRTGNAEVFVMHADGSGQTNLTNSSDYDGEPTWSPDGTKIAFISRRTGSYRVYVMNADGSNPVMLSQQRYSENPVWSPNGTKIVYDADADLDDWQELWVMNADGSGQSLLVDASGGPYHVFANGWSPDNTWVTYTAVHLIYYYGEWYWDYTNLVRLDINTGYQQTINPSRDTDWNLDWTTTDVQPPTTAMSVPPSPVIYQFTVTWWGQDVGSGLVSYDVQVRDGAGGAWTDWQMATIETSATFTGIGGHEYFFRTRAIDNAFNLQPWPGSPQASAKVESSPPITSVSPLEQFTRGDQVTLTWGGFDQGGSGIGSYDVLYMDDAVGTWETFESGAVFTTTVFTGLPGHTYHFSSRGTDRAMNKEAQHTVGDSGTTFFTWLTYGTAYDHTGVPVSEMDLTVDPPAFITSPSDIDGNYSAYLADNPEIKTINWMKDGYGALPTTDYGFADANVDVYLPPVDNIVQDFGFESGTLPGEWQGEGEYLPTITSTESHTGGYAAFLGVPHTLGDRTVFSEHYPEYLPGQNPQLFFDKSGYLHVAWSEGGYSNPHQFYYLQRLPDGTWLSPELVLEQNAWDNTPMGVVVDESSNVHLLICVANIIWYMVRDPAGNWTTPYVLFDEATLVGMKIDTSSTIHAVYRGFQGIVTYARLEPGGAWQSEPLMFSDNQYSIQFLTTPQGVIHLSWLSFANNTINYMIRQLDGSWLGPINVYSQTGIISMNMAIDSNGISHMVLTENYPQYKLSYSTLYPDGTYTSPVVIADSGSYPKVLIDQTDTIYAIWADETGDQDIHFSEKPANGIWSIPQNISRSFSRSVSVDGAVSRGGDIIATWQEIDTQVVYYAIRYAGGWSEPIQLSEESGNAWYAKVGFDIVDGATIVWAQGSVYPGLNFIRTLTVNQSGSALLSQSLTVPISMTHPTLSLLASLSGVSDVSGNEFQVQVTSGITTTTLFTTTTPTAWEHSWFDMSPWSGQEITLTFQLSENAGFPPANAILDEVTLGAAHPDVWVDLSGSPLSAIPGQQLTFQLEYGNRGAVLAASSLITVTLPGGLSFVDASVPPTIIGNQLVWQVGDLPGNSDPNSITLTVEVDTDAVLGRVVSLLAEIETLSSELELMNNISQAITYLGHVGLLPVIRR